MQIAGNGLRLLRRIGQKAGPYIVLEMLLPGGTLFALLLFLYRRRPRGIGGGARRPTGPALRTLAGAFDKCILASIPLTLEPQRSTTMSTRS
jgi:hypothetical protein